MKEFAIVIPFYTNNISILEKYSLDAALRIFRTREIFFVSPFNLKIDNKYSNIKVVRFKQSYFTSLNGYNQLLLSDIFYEKFLSYKYILIYQLDSLAFSDDLDYWSSLNYDYYGAPWVEKSWKYKYFNLFGLINRNVGNGGFCLRNTQVFYKMSCKIRYLRRLILFGEDIFWCNYGKLLNRKFNVISEEHSIRFSFETCPDVLYKMTGNTLPFGCHAYKRYNPSFWKNVISDLPISL